MIYLDFTVVGGVWREKSLHGFFSLNTSYATDAGPIWGSLLYYVEEQEEEDGLQ